MIQQKLAAKPRNPMGRASVSQTSPLSQSIR